MSHIEKQKRMGFNIVELVVTMVFICSLMALVTPLLQKARVDEVRTQSVNNLKNIALAMHGFHDANKRLPFNGSDVAVGDAKYSTAAKANEFTSGSWGFQLAPYIEARPLFTKVDRTY